MRIAYQGEPGAYSEAAALMFEPSATPVPCRSFDEVFDAVESGDVERGILPMENSIGGSIHRNYDLLVEHELPIVGEVEVRVDHCLMALPGVQIADIRVVHSHPQALAQCERFLKNMSGVEIAAEYDTAGGAKLIREGRLRHIAAIASRRAAASSSVVIVRCPSPIMATHVRPCQAGRIPPFSPAADRAPIDRGDGVRALRRGERLPDACRLAVCRLRIQDGLLRVVMTAPQVTAST